MHQYDINNQDMEYMTLLSDLQDAKGVSYGNDHIYVGDSGTGNVYKLNVGEQIDLNHVKPWLQIPGVYGVHCVNESDDDFAAGLVAGLLLILLS